MGGVIAPSGCHVPPWCGDREGWLPWWPPGTVDPFWGSPAGQTSASILVARRPAGLPRPALPSPCLAVDPRIDALEVMARWPCEARARAAEDQLPAPDLARAGRRQARMSWSAGCT